MSPRWSCLVLLLVSPFFLACNSVLGLGQDDGGNGGDGGTSDAFPNGTRCTGLQCQVQNCQGKGTGTTSLSGEVNIPAGNLPLYNATVYVPNAAVADITDGPSCDRCDDALSGSPVTLAHTDVTGHFTLKDVPVGKDIPLVISVGKWRRQITIPEVPACIDTPLDPVATRLPKNQAEGHLPRIALTTGGFDAIECLLRKLGIDPMEFTPEADGGRVNLFTGHGGTDAYDKRLNHGAPFTVASDTSGKSDGWWSNLSNLKKYDILVLSCEGHQFLEEKSASARAALQSFIDLGGRAFASHWHNAWIQGGPAPLSTVATFYSQDQSQNFSSADTTIDQSFDKGQALATWLHNVGGSPQLGSLTIKNARNTVHSIDGSLTQRFVYYNDPNRGGAAEAQYFTFNAPVGAAAGAQCGRMVFTDMHVSGNDANAPDPKLDISNPQHPFPNGCVTTELSAQEKALIFLLFDLSGCVQPILG